jgi:hypothetical protein
VRPSGDGVVLWTSTEDRVGQTSGGDVLLSECAGEGTTSREAGKCEWLVNERLSSDKVVVMDGGARALLLETGQRRGGRKAGPGWTREGVGC